MGGIAIAGHADAADQPAIFVKRHAAGCARQSAGDGQRPGNERQTGRTAVADDAAGALNLLMSENYSCEKFTPTSGPGGLLSMPGGKCCCTMKPAVREVKALLSLLKNAAVPALAMASADQRSAAVGLVFSAQTPSTQPSRSVTAMTALVKLRFGERSRAGDGLRDDLLHVGQRELRLRRAGGKGGEQEKMRNRFTTSRR